MQLTYRPSSIKNVTTLKRQQGVVLPIALLMLAILTTLGIFTLDTSSRNYAQSTTKVHYNLTQEAAESAARGAIFEAQDEIILRDDLVFDPLSEARGGATYQADNNDLSCYDNYSRRTVTSANLQTGVNNNAAGNYNESPKTEAWSRTAFVAEAPCKGFSEVLGDNSLTCHYFVVRGCGTSKQQPNVQAVEITVSVLAPATR